MRERKKNVKEKGRKKRSQREREKERKKKKKFNERREKFNKIFFLTLSYSAQPYKAMHSSNEDKIFTFSSTAASLVFMCSGAKNNFLAF